MTPVPFDIHLQKFETQPVVIFSAPGRVNLIGEHTDYNQGLCLPIALPEQTNVAYSPSTRDMVRAHSTNLNLSESRHLNSGPSGSWTDYIVGAHQTLKNLGYDVGAGDFTVSSSIPLGGGVSSSAAFCVAVLRALNGYWRFGLDGPGIAKIAQKVENDFIGLPCGLMDQMASSVGQAGAPLLFDTLDNSTKSYELIGGTTVIVFNSGVERRLAGSEYSERREQCANACEALGVESLRHATLPQVAAIQDPLVLRRAKHVVSENDRVRAACEALVTKDAAWLGQLLNQGHESLRDDFDVSVPPVDHLVQVCLESGALGARITGAGFGGCIVVLCENHLVDQVKQAALALPAVSLVSEIAA